MPYPNVKSLPQTVKDKLKGSKRRQWMHVWNSSYNRHKNESRAFAEAWAAARKLGKSLTMPQDFNLFLPLSKVERQKDGSVTVSGYASTPAMDLDNEIVSLDAVKNALPGYWQWRNIREMHQHSAVGVGQEAHVDDRGLFLTARITDPIAAQKCLDQVYKGFSIGGKKLSKSGNTITEIDLIEVSVVDRPANPECRIEVAKRYKERSQETGGYLVKVLSGGRDPAQRALSKMAQAVEILSKEEKPPNANDGFHFTPTQKNDGHTHDIECETGPPIEKGNEKFHEDGTCVAHGKKDCPQCLEKREVKRGERESLASQGKALPDGSFPIKNKKDLANARQAIGRAKNPAKAKALIRRRAKELGVKLPPAFKKKAALKLIKKLQDKFTSAQPSFLTLSADDGRGTVEGKVGKFGHELPPGLELKRSQPLKDGPISSISKKGKDMTVDTSADNLSKMLEEHLEKAGRPPSKAARMNMARGNMKKAKNQMKECGAAINAAHEMHKEAYLSKLAKKKDSDSPTDFDHEKAMKFLQKAYSDLSTLKTFVKAADVQIKKAAGRVGERGQMVDDPEPGYYQVPMGITNYSNEELTTLGPSAGTHGSKPEHWSSDERHKMAKKSYTPEEVEALTRAATAEAKVELLEKMPALPSGGRKPALFDTTKLGLGIHDKDSTSLFKDVNPAALASDDENVRRSAVGKVIGNMIVNGHGRPVFDPDFHGTAGAGRAQN